MERHCDYLKYMEQYGSYLKYEDGDEERAKELLKRQLHSLIDKLCEDEDFWIKKERDCTGKDPLRLANTVGWKIAVPQIEYRRKERLRKE